MSSVRWALAFTLLGVACQGRYVIGSEPGASATGDSTSSTGTPPADGSGSDSGDAGSGDASEGTSSGSSTSGSTSTGGHCAAELGESPCETCLAEACCELATSCVDDPTCACILACRLEGHSLVACETDCGGATQPSIDLHDCSFDACDGCF